MATHPIVQLEVTAATERDYKIIQDRIKDMQPIKRDDHHFSVLTSTPSDELLAYLQAGLSSESQVKILGRHTLVHDDPRFGS